MIGWAAARRPVLRAPDRPGSSSFSSTVTQASLLAGPGRQGGVVVHDQQYLGRARVLESRLDRSAGLLPSPLGVAQITTVTPRSPHSSVISENRFWYDVFTLFVTAEFMLPPFMETLVHAVIHRSQRRPEIDAEVLVLVICRVAGESIPQIH